ncbi:N(2)-acetyl-L-2,4-diaminobutanoate deacetylase DoeB2 [Haliea sp. E17]|uniref:N(2)-acetyl-L-2,4-diaminobutanoate deacetylase DoeB2 n=1 Tax=Haliea sp. E17 TaxID=3401576 RepID=UPI003AAAA805
MQASWSRLLDETLTLRHLLHRLPELTWQEHNTAELIRNALDRLHIPWRACARHGTLATLAPTAGGDHIALRADIDALPITEATGLDYQSENRGCMHACGHDGHTAVLWGAAALLKRREAELPGPVTLLFQPAEEGGHGAREMIAEGALDGIDRIFGWHNWPAIPLGKAACPDGPVMSGNGTFEITLTGKGGHASQPELCRNPVVAVGAIAVNLQQIVAQRLAPQDAAVVAVTSIDAPSGSTTFPDTAKLGGSIRLGRPGLREPINALIRQISENIAHSYGVVAQVEIVPRYEATINHACAARVYREALAGEMGEHWNMENLPLPIMASEDFSYYLDNIPGAFALVGMAQEERFAIPCHSPRYQFNDALIAPMVRTFCRLAGLEPQECGPPG